MVKNYGGKKTKGVARKSNLIHSNFDIKLRLSTSSLEKYAIVRKLFGNSCSVFCDDSKERLAMISGKFSGRNKRNNIISPGVIVLIGIRDWATVVDGKIEKCDILEIYSSQELDQLKQRPSFPIHFIDSAINDFLGQDSKSTSDIFVFSSVEETPLIQHSDTDTKLFMDTGEEINIDDI